MNVLGVCCWGQHESSAALVVDGSIVAAVEQERFSRRKFDSALPLEAVRWCLGEGGVGPGELDAVAFYWRPWLHPLRKAWHVLSRLPDSARALLGPGARHARLLDFPRAFRAAIPEQRGARIRFLPHHPSHAAQSFLLSPFDEAAIVTVDGAGEWASTWIGVGRGATLQPLGETYWPHSLGHFYAAVTEHLGFRKFADEYKVMGLAAYGEPARHRAALGEVLRLGERGRYALDLSFFDFPGGDGRMVSERFEERFGPPRPPEGPLEPHHADLAAATQERLEEALLHVARDLVRRTGLRRLCLGGGVALNGVAVGRLLREAVVDAVFVPPAASDSGTALGAALLLGVGAGAARPAPLLTARLGPAYDDAQIRRALAGRRARRVTDPAATVADLVADGAIVGFHQGRLEFGARALGGRSILADPRRAEMKDVINARVKFREGFRPFAPAILDEARAEWFAVDHPSPFMNVVLPFRPDRRAAVPAVVHADGTGRLQTVTQASDPLFHALLSRFRERTGVPMVLNTSFNEQGEPIVNTPDEALDCFRRTGLDHMVIGDWLVSRDGDGSTTR